MRGIDYLRTGRAELLEGDGEDAARLREAARLFRRAVLVGRQTWPRGRRGEADALRERLGTGGDIDRAVDGMDEAAMRAASDALWQFCDAAWAGDFLRAETSDGVRDSPGADAATFEIRDSEPEVVRPAVGAPRDGWEPAPSRSSARSVEGARCGPS